MSDRGHYGRRGPDGAAVRCLRERATTATDVAFTLTDPRQEDNPLVWVNPAFTRLTGYAPEDVVGRNCRLLQGAGSDRAVVAELRAEIVAHRTVTRTLLNYRKDGTTFWNQVTVSPVLGDDGELVGFVGVQTDVTERVRSETADALERTAREDAERARLRLTLLADAGAELASTVDPAENLERLGRLVVPGFADWVVIRLVDEAGQVERSVARHCDGHAALLDQYCATTAHELTDESGVRRVLESGRPLLVAEADPDQLRRSVSDGRTIEIATDLGVRSLMYVPLIARRRLLGTMTFVFGASGRTFDGDDLALAAELGRRAGLALDNARLYLREQRVSETLQRSLLPELPHVPGLAVAARYVPGDAEADVGGDWYELLPLPDGSVGIAVGDVVGHDLAAAAAMGHLRGLLRACAWTSTDTSEGDPARVLERVDRMTQTLHVVPLATLLFARLLRPASRGDPWCLRWSSAGHPPMLVRDPDGAVRSLDEAGGVLLGVTGAERSAATTTVQPGSCLVGFTDGLVERRGESLDTGIERLAGALRAADPSDLDAMVAALLDAMKPDGSDDTALLAVRILPGGPDFGELDGA